MNVLTIDRLSAGYRRRRVLEQLSLTVDAGEILAVLGENGCGKTTLLRAIQGSLPLADGTITVNGVDLAGLSTRRRAALVTTMGQDLSAEAGLTGMDRIEMGFYPSKGLFGRLTERERETIRTMADSFGILPLLERDLSAMSTGERQMITLLRAAVQDTPVLLLDEPASALDFNRTERLFSLLRRLADRGKAIVIVLHDPTQALRHADKLLIMTCPPVILRNLREEPPERLEPLLRKLYPNLRIHRNPWFCYGEPQVGTDRNKEETDHHDND